MIDNIRRAVDKDHNNIHKLYLHSFPAAENQLVAKLATDLSSKEPPPDTISFVAEINGKLVGHIAFSPVTANSLPHWSGFILAPLAVEPELQRKGIGAGLVKTGLESLEKNGVNSVFVYGDPEYYSQFGFNAKVSESFLPPYKLQHPFGWQAKLLHEFEAPKQAIKLSCVEPLCIPALW